MSNPGACRTRRPVIGAKLVFSGSRTDGETLQRLFEDEQVTMSLGVPTIWLGLLDYLRSSGKRIDSVKMILSGGAAPPLSMIEAFEYDYGVDVNPRLGHDRDQPGGRRRHQPQGARAAGSRRPAAREAQAGAGAVRASR